MRLRFLASYALRDTYDPRTLIARVPSWAPVPEVMLDSGAFTAHKQGRPVTVEGLIGWFRDHDDLRPRPLMAGLDVLYDAATTRRNCERMRDAGLTVFPTVHLGTSPTEITAYARAGWTRVALGGLVNAHVPIGKRAAWMRSCQAVAAREGVALHGFGWAPMSRAHLDTVRRCDTVDTSSQNQTTQYGNLPVLDGIAVRQLNLRRDKAAIRRLLGANPGIEPGALTTVLRWGNARGKGASAVIHAIGGSQYLAWGEKIGTRVFLSSFSHHAIARLYDTVLTRREAAA